MVIFGLSLSFELLESYQIRKAFWPLFLQIRSLLLSLTCFSLISFKMCIFLLDYVPLGLDFLYLHSFLHFPFLIVFCDLSPEFIDCSGWLSLLLSLLSLQFRYVLFCLFSWCSKVLLVFVQVYFSVALMKYSDQNQLIGEDFYFSLRVTFSHLGKPRKELKQRQWSNYLQASSGLPHLSSLWNTEPASQGGTSHSGLWSPLSIST